MLPRNSLAWMLVAQVAVTLPLLNRLPLWISLLCGLCIVWRVQVFRERMAFPARWLSRLLVVSGSIGALASYGLHIHLQSMVALLTVVYFLKLLEMRLRRDAYASVFITYFMIAIVFLHHQSLAMAVYLLSCVVLTTTALIGLTQTQGHSRPLHSVALASKLILQAVPLMLVAFIFFPRLPPLWSMPTDDNRARIGMSDSMSPGDFTSLGRSTELAFRVTFEGDIPPVAVLYWRGLVFDRFDGRRWMPADPPEEIQDPIRWFGSSEADWESGFRFDGEPLRYEVLLEPTRHVWLYSLTYPQTDMWGTGITFDYRLISDTPLHQSFLYQARAYPAFAAVSPLAEWQRRRYLQLPEDGNPRARQLAAQWRSESRHDAEIVENALDRYRQAFTYTLTPPGLGEHSVDEFLFETRKGFCEHFASSFVFLMRAAGLPARVVAGYQGGEINPDENYLLVHQYDAHAWAEVWIDGRGWRRIDPTAAVAPERIEKGMGDMMADGAVFGDEESAGRRLRHNPLISALRLKLDWANYAWTRWVVGYRADMQRDALTRWLGEFDSRRIAIALGILSSLAIGIVALFVFRQRAVKQLDPATRHYLRFCRKMEKIGLARCIGETPADFTRRATRKRPDLSQRVNDIQQQYYHLVYAMAKPTAAELQALARAVSGFRPRKRPLAR